MSDELRNSLLSEADKITVPPASSRAVAERGRLLRRRKRLAMFAMSGLGLAAMVVLTSSVASLWTSTTAPGDSRIGSAQKPSNGASVSQGQAAIAALAAVQELPQKWDRLYDYRGVEEADGSWLAHFTVRSCVYERGGMTCPEVGDAQLEIEVTTPDVSVVEATGAVTAEERSTLVGYSTDKAHLAPGYVFEHIRTIDTPSGRVVISAAYWLGEIPASVRGSCQLQGVDDGGAVVMQRQEDRVGPSEEGARDFLNMTEVPREVVSTRVVCSGWREFVEPSPTP